MVNKSATCRRALYAVLPEAGVSAQFLIAVVRLYEVLLQSPFSGTTPLDRVRGRSPDPDERVLPVTEPDISSWFRATCAPSSAGRCGHRSLPGACVTRTSIKILQVKSGRIKPGPFRHGLAVVERVVFPIPFWRRDQEIAACPAESRGFGGIIRNR